MNEMFLPSSSSFFPHVVERQHMDDVCLSLLSHPVPLVDTVLIVDSTTDRLIHFDDIRWKKSTCAVRR